MFQKFRDVFSKKESKSYNSNLINIANDLSQYAEVDEATGAIAAELTDVIVKKFY